MTFKDVFFRDCREGLIFAPLVTRQSLKIILMRDGSLSKYSFKDEQQKESSVLPAGYHRRKRDNGSSTNYCHRVGFVEAEGTNYRSEFRLSLFQRAPSTTSPCNTWQITFLAAENLCKVMCLQCSVYQEI